MFDGQPLRQIKVIGTYSVLTAVQWRESDDRRT